MRYVFVSAIAAILLASACGGSESPREAPEPSPTSSAIDYGAVPPEPVGPVPEGVLLVQKESQSPTTFGVSADGGVRRYGQGLHYVTSPDGRSVAFVKRDGSNQPSGVGIVTADGREVFEAQTPQASHGADPIFFPTLLWSPDGSRLAYTLSDEANTEQSWVYTVNADGSRRQRITATANYYSLIGWTADGLLLAGRWSDEGVSVLTMGAKSVELPIPEVSIDNVDLNASPDGRYVAFLAGDWEEGFELWVLEIESGRSWLVADMGYIAAQPASGLYVSAGIPLGLEQEETDDLLLKGPPPVTWSPDGSRIAYYRRSGTDADGAYVSELRVVEIESGRDIGVTLDQAWQAVWSPDGRYLAAIRDAIRQVRDVLLFRPDGSMVVLNVRASQLLWTGDDMLLAAYPGGVSLVDPSSGEVQAALTAEGDNVYGAGLWGEAGVWSPDGRFVAFATSKLSHRKANSSLYVLDAQTGDVTLIVEGGSFRPVGWLSE